MPKKKAPKQTASQRYIELVKQKICREDMEKYPTTDDVSQYRIAKELGISQPRLRHYIGGRPFDDDMCCIVGQYLGITEVFVVLDVLEDRTTDPDTKAAIQKQNNIIQVDFGKKIANKAKALAVGSMFVLAGLVGQAENGHAAPFSEKISSEFYILCQIVRRALERLRRRKNALLSSSSHNPPILAI